MWTVISGVFLSCAIGFSHGTTDILFIFTTNLIFMYHIIDYHIFADDTQLYISFNCKESFESLLKLYF